MRFCQYNYREFNNTNKDKHPIQPYHWDNWRKMYNEDYIYCQKFNWWKWVVCYFWIYVGRVRYCDLPSHHPYWRRVVRKKFKESLKKTIAIYDECKKNPEKIKYHYNITTSLKDIEKKIEDYKLKLKQ